MNELLGQTKISKLVWKICVPMIFSMMLLAAYTVIDASFVVNMDPVQGLNANLAITYAFPVQVMSGSLGVGVGIGINALLSKSLGEKDYSKASKFIYERGNLYHSQYNSSNLSLFSLLVSWHISSIF